MADDREIRDFDARREKMVALCPAARFESFHTGNCQSHSCFFQPLFLNRNRLPRIHFRLSLKKRAGAAGLKALVSVKVKLLPLEIFVASVVQFVKVVRRLVLVKIL